MTKIIESQLDRFLPGPVIIKFQLSALKENYVLLAEVVGHVSEVSALVMGSLVMTSEKHL